jgi:hypothetical protein
MAFGVGDALGVAGFATSIFGGLEAAQGAKQKAALEKQIAGMEMQVNEQRRLAMETNNRRMQTETIRKAQVARSLALSAGVGQGAQFSSSGMSAQQGAASGAAWNVAGMSANLQIGEKIFDYDSMISNAKMSIADAESKEAQGLGIAAIGKGISGLGGMKFWGGGGD